MISAEVIEKYKQAKVLERELMLNIHIQAGRICKPKDLKHFKIFENTLMTTRSGLKQSKMALIFLFNKRF